MAGPSPPPLPVPPAPGWYSDPWHQGQRYWDGEHWTERLRAGGNPTLTFGLVVLALGIVGSVACLLAAMAMSAFNSHDSYDPNYDLEQALIGLAILIAASAVLAGAASTAVGLFIVAKEPRRLSAAPLLATREVAVHKRVFDLDLGTILFAIGIGFYLGFALLAWIAPRLALAGKDFPGPAFYLASRRVATLTPFRERVYATTYYHPGLALALLPIIVIALHPWRQPSVMKRYGWRRIGSAIGAAIAFAVAMVTALIASSEGFTLALGCYLLIAVGAIALVGALIQLLTLRRRPRVDSSGHALDVE